MSPHQRDPTICQEFHMRDRRSFLKTLPAGAAWLSVPEFSSATIPFPIRPKIQRKGSTLLVGYFGDSTTRGAWANNNPFPNNYSYNDLTPLIKSALSDFAPVSVYQQGNDGESAVTLLKGAYIPNSRVTVGPFSTRLAEYPYDAVIVGVGIVDAIFGQSQKQFQTSLDGISSAAQSANIPILFETPNPIPLSAYSANLELYRPCFGAYELVVDQNFPMAMSDEFHPTTAAYIVKTNRIAEALRNCMIRRYMMVDV